MGTYVNLKKIQILIVSRSKRFMTVMTDTYHNITIRFLSVINILANKNRDLKSVIQLVCCKFFSRWKLRAKSIGQFLNTFGSNLFKPPREHMFLAKIINFLKRHLFKSLFFIISRFYILKSSLKDKPNIVPLDKIISAKSMQPLLRINSIDKHITNLELNSIFYWVIFSPNLVGVVSGFTVGIFYDLLCGVPLGSSGLVLALVAFITGVLRNRLRQIGFWQRLLVVVFLVTLQQLLYLWLQVFLGREFAGVGYFVGIGISIVTWPLLFIFMQSYQRRLRLL